MPRGPGARSQLGAQRSQARSRLNDAENVEIREINAVIPSRALGTRRFHPLASLTVAVNRLGMWRQEMYTKHDVGAEVARHREESSKDFARLERRFGVFDDFVAAANEHRVATERWQSRVDTRLDGHDRELNAVTGRVERVEEEGVP